MEHPTIRATHNHWPLQINLKTHVLAFAKPAFEQHGSEGAKEGIVSFPEFECISNNRQRIVDTLPRRINVRDKKQQTLQHLDSSMTLRRSLQVTTDNVCIMFSPHRP